MNVKNEYNLMNELFRKVARWTSNKVGSSYAFSLAMLVVLIWAVTGPVFHYSDTWQLIINTGTTILTFLMVFLIQNTQNRDGRAMQLKLDEIIRGTKRTRNRLIDLENLSDAEMDLIHEQFHEIYERANKRRTKADEVKIRSQVEMVEINNQR